MFGSGNKKNDGNSIVCLLDSEVHRDLYPDYISQTENTDKDKRYNIRKYLLVLYEGCINIFCLDYGVVELDVFKK